MWVSPPFWLVPSTDTTSTSQHSDTDMVILFGINHGLFGEVVGVEPALLVKELTLFIQPCPLTVAYPFGHRRVARPLVVKDRNALLKLGVVAFDSPAQALDPGLSFGALLFLRSRKPGFDSPWDYQNDNELQGNL